MSAIGPDRVRDTWPPSRREEAVAANESVESSALRRSHEGHEVVAPSGATQHVGQHRRSLYGEGCAGCGLSDLVPYPSEWSLDRPQLTTPIGDRRVGGRPTELTREGLGRSGHRPQSREVDTTIG